MKIIINNSSMVPIYEQIMEQIKAQIISGELKENDILPSVRTMAKELKISALTVKKAYDNLEAEGMTVTVQTRNGSLPLSFRSAFPSESPLPDPPQLLSCALLPSTVYSKLQHKFLFHEP